MCKDLRAGVICSHFPVLFQNPGNSVLHELLMVFLGRSITIIHPAGDEGVHKFL